jgi:LysR family glycine cleavage system transcriptional activator
MPPQRPATMRLPSLKYLKTFQVAATRLSFRAAAEELCIAPSAVSHQVKGLEEQLGVALLERGPSSLTLTEASASYLQHMETLFSRLETVTEQLSIRYGRDVVRMNIPPFFATEMLLPRLLSFLEVQPDTDVHINTQATSLQSHPAEADLSIVVDAASEEIHDHACHNLFSQTFVPVCSPTLLQRLPIDSVEDPNKHTLIIHEARRDGWQRWSQTLGIDLRPKNIVRFDSMNTAAEAAEHGVGLALVSSRLGNDRFSQGSLVKPFDRELETGESYYLILRREDAGRPNVKALTQWLIDEFSVAAWSSCRSNEFPIVYVQRKGSQGIFVFYLLGVTRMNTLSKSVSIAVATLALAAPFASRAGIHDIAHDTAMNTCISAFVAASLPKQQPVTVQKEAGSTSPISFHSRTYKIVVNARGMESGKRLAHGTCIVDRSGQVVTFNGKPLNHKLAAR